MEITSLITVRTTSTRLPGKCLLPFGDFNVLEHIIKRALHYNLNPIVCTTLANEDNIIEKIAAKEKVRCFRGSNDNKLKRWLDCCNRYNIEAFHTIDADDPFFNGQLMRMSMNLLNNGYDLICPTKSSNAGNGSVGYSIRRELIRKCLEGVDNKANTESIINFLNKVPNIKVLDLPEKNPPHRILRLTLDYEEDYWLLRSVQRIVGNYADRIEIDNLFKDNPDLYKVNWFRNVQWAEGQLKAKKSYKNT